MDKIEIEFMEKYKRIRKNSEMYSKIYSFNKTPLVMSILVTNRCTLKCKHCFNHLNQGKIPNVADKEELSYEHFEKISKSMGSFMKVLFSGGEPFIRKDFKDIVLLFAQNNNLTHISITTNGQDTDAIIEQIEYILQRINKRVYLSLGFSLDGFKEYHELIRGDNTFEKCIETWNFCKSLEKKYGNFDMYICSTINTINEDTMADFLQWCIDYLCPKSIALLKTRQSPRAGDFIKDISLKNYKDSMEVIKKATKSGKFGDRSNPQTYVNTQICEYVYSTSVKNRRTFECFAGKYGGFINYNGDVGICEIIKPYANLVDYNYDFKNLWDDLLKNKICNIDKCYSCTHETEGIIPSIFFGRNEIEYIR